MKALITGVSGQDGFYLSELLISKGYEVHGMLRRTTNKKLSLPKEVKLHWATLENYGSIYKLINDVKPDEVYHLAAQSFVTNSFEDEFSTMSTNIHGTHYMLNACKEVVPQVKFYFAGSSEMYGNQPSPQNETTPMTPVSPYGVSKLAGYNLCKYYRDAFKMFVCCGIMFNHESPRRGVEFVTQKICKAAQMKVKVKLGNLDAKRDWGYAGDYVKAMWLMLQQKVPGDYVIATGQTHTVKEICELTGVEYEVDPALYRPNELHELRGDYTRANVVLGWEPETKFEQLIRMMLND